MGLFNALVDAVKGAAEAIGNAFSGGSSDSSSGSSSSGSAAYDPAEVAISQATGAAKSSGNYNGWTNPLVPESTPARSSDSSAYWSGESTETHNVAPLTDAQSTANQNYESAQRAYNDFVTQNAGYNTNDGSDYYYQQDLARLQQNLDDAERAKSYFNQSTENYAPSYKASDELNGTSAEDARAAAQRAADIANERGQSRTNYLKTYMTEDSNWTNSKYLTPENNNRDPSLAYDPADWQAEQAYGARNSTADYMTGAERAAAAAPDPNKPYEKNYQYATRDELLDMDQNDAWNPSYRPSNGETSYFKGNQETPADPYVTELEKAQQNAYYNPPLKETWLDQAGEKINNFLTGFGKLFQEPTPELAQARTAMEEAENAMYAAVLPQDEAALRKDYEEKKAQYDKLKTEHVNLQKEAVSAAENGTLEKNPQLEAIYNGMPKWQQAIRRLELAAEGGLQLAGLATFITTPLTKATGILKKAAGDIPTALDLDLPHRYVYSIANGMANPVKNGVLATEMTQEQWDALPADAKRTLEELYKIDSLDEFNQALKETNDLVSSNEYYKEGMDNIRDEILFDEQIKKFHDYSQQMISEAGYGLPKFWQNVINLVPSEMNMVVQAMFSNWSGWKHAGLMLMGDQVYGETYLDDRYAGYDHEHSANHAFASMLNEVGWELVDGGGVLNQMAYGNKGLFTAGVDAAIAKLDSATMQFIFKHASGTLGEIIEEEGTQGFEPFVDALLEESDYWQTVKEKYGEQRAEDYLWAALGAVIMTEGSNIATDVTTSAVNRFNEGKTNKKTGQPKYVAPNIDGTSTEENSNGKKAYSATMQQVAALNQEKVVGNNPLAKAAYEQARKSGTPESDAFRVAEAVHEATSGLTPEEKKAYANDQDKFNADIDAFQEHGDEFRNAEVGDVILDINNNEVGVVTKADDKGITVELTNADGEKTAEEVKFVGNNGLLDAESDLAKALGKYNEGAIVNAEEAKTFVKEAAERRQAEEARRAATQAQEVTDSGTGTVTQQQAQQQEEQPVQKSPAPIKPASNEATDSGTGTVATEQAETQTTNPLVQQERKASGEERAEEQTPPAPKTETTTTSTNPLVQEERNTSGGERAEQQEPKAPKTHESSIAGFLTNESPETDAKFEGTFSDTDYRVRYVGNEKEGDSSTRQYTISVKGKDGKYHTVGENGQPTRFYADEVGDAVSKAIADSNRVVKTPGRSDIGTAEENYQDFNATISIAQSDLAGSMETEADYHGQSITVEHQLGGGYVSHLDNGISFSGKTVAESLGQAIEYLYTHETDEEWNKYEDQKRGEAAQPESNSPSTPNALADAATGKKPATSQNASESPTIASDETGNSVPTQAQESSQAPNEMLNAGSEEEAASETEEYYEEVKDVKNENPTKNNDYRYFVDVGTDDSERLQSLIEQYDGTHRKEAVTSRLKAFAKKAGMNTDEYGLYDRMLDAVLGITETSGANYSVEGLQYDTVSDVAYAKSNDKGNTRNMSRDAYENQDRDDYADERQTEPQGKFSDEDAAEIIQLLGEYAELTSNEEEDATQEEIEEDASKYKDTGRGFDFTPDDSNDTEAYDWKKVSQYMAEENRDTVAERKTVLEELFPDKEFRISDDGNSIEEVHGHKTSKNPFTSKEQSWWEKNGWKEIISKFTTKLYGTKNLIPAWLRKGGYNKTLTDTTAYNTAGNRLFSQSMQYNGLRYYYQVGQGMYRHILDSNIMSGIKEVVEHHQDAADALRNRIKNGEFYLSITKNPEKTLAAVNNLKEQLAKEEAWLEKARSGKYTLKDFYNDKSGVVTQDDIKTVLDSIKGEDKTYDDFSFKSLQNAMSESFAKELIDSIYKEAVKNGLDTRGSTGSNTQIQSAEEGINIRSGNLETGSTGSTPTGYSGSAETGRQPGSVTGLSAYDVQQTKGQTVSGGYSGRQAEYDSGNDEGVLREKDRSADFERLKQESRNRATEIANDYNDGLDTNNVYINDRGHKGDTTQTVPLAKDIGENMFLVGSAKSLDSSTYSDDTTKSQAETLENAAAELGVPVVVYNGNIYQRIGNYDVSIDTDTFSSTDPDGYSEEIGGYYDSNDGCLVLPELKSGDLNREQFKVAAHEMTHKATDLLFGDDGERLLSFTKGIFDKAGVDYDNATKRIRKVYSKLSTVWSNPEYMIADESLSFIAQGFDFGGILTNQDITALRQALMSTDEFSGLKNLDMGNYLDVITIAGADVTVNGVGKKIDYGKNRAATSVGYTPSIAPTESQAKTTYYPLGERETPETSKQRTARLTGEAVQALTLGDFDRAQELLRMAGTAPTQTREFGPPGELYDMYAEPNGTTRVGNTGLKPDATQAQKDAADPRRKEVLDTWSDETFDALIEEENAREAAALEGVGTPIDQQDIDSLVNEASADEIDLLNSRGGNVSAEDTGRFNNLVDQASASEEETLNSFREGTPDITSEGAFNNLVETENESVENALNEAAESSANQYPERRFKDAKDYYGKAYDEVVSKVATKHARVSSRSSFTHADIYKKLYGNTLDAEYNFGRLQKLNQNIDSLLKGKMSAYAFNAFAKNMASEQGIAQILNDDIQKEFADLAKLEEKATGKDRNESDVINFQYAAADAVAHLCARMDMVEKTERARARLDTLAKEHGKTNKKAIGNALDWYNRMQISGDNFWRMAGNWDAASRNQGYALAQEHNKCIATRISEEAKLKDYFSGINKNSKEFRDFANGTTMSNVDFEGHKISLMEAVKFVKICDTMRAFANENRRPDWQRVAALGGFAFEGKDGKPVFVDIQGSKKNGGSERVKWVREHYDAAMAEIQANKAASEYMKACEEMYWDASQTAEKVHSKVNGYDRYMYGKGKYTDIHYANKDGTVDFSYKDRDAIDVHDTGIMQKRTRVNGGYVICNPMSRSIDAYISQISNYIAFEEFGQKLGVLNDSKSINGNYANTVGDAYGSQYSQWFDNYVKSMTLYRETDPKKLTDKALQKARQAMMTGALSLSVSVPIKQVSSFFDTMGMLDPRAVRKVFATNPFGVKQKGIKNYLFESRGQSISDPDIAELFGDKGLFARFKNTGVGRTIMKATNIMDETAVSNVYMACVYDTELNTLSADKLYKNGKNFKDGLTTEGQFYVDSKFEQVLLGTQPIFTPQARNELARTDNQLLRMFQTFRTQQTQNYNRSLQALNEWKAASKNGGDTGAAFKKVRQTVQGQLAASVSLAALNAIATTLLHKHHKYKDDDDEFDKEKFWKRFGLDALESFMGNALWIGDLTKWAIDRADISDSREFYGVASGALGTAWTIGTSAVDLYRNIQEDGWTQSNKVSARYLAGNIATAFGKPLNNAYAMINAGWQWYADLAGIERKYDDIFLQWAYVTDTPQNRLANAILKDDKNAIADLIDEIGEDKLSNTVSYGALDKYKQGKIDEAEYVEILMNFANMSYKDASKEVQKKKALIDSGVSQYNGIDGRDGRAAFYEQYSDNFKSRQAYKDFFADVKAGKADGKHKTYYTTYNGKQSEVTANQSSIIDRMNENIKAGNFDYNTAKLLWEKYYGYSSSKWSAWRYVGK